jgi:hypothetical protein
MPAFAQSGRHDIHQPDITTWQETACAMAHRAA